MKNEENDWGFYLLHYQNWAPNKEGIHRYHFKPVYTIHQDTLESKGYINLIIPKDEDILYLITAIRMYHFCHVFYQRLPQYLPLVSNEFTNRGNVKKVRIYKVKDFER